MDPTLALVCCTVFVAILLAIEARSQESVSAVSWLPTIWMLLAGSKPLAVWFGAPGFTLEDTTEAGSLLDRAALAVLITAGVAVALRRKAQWRTLAARNIWLLVLLTYTAVSVVWSEYPLVSFKRWIRTIGPVMMGVVIITEPVSIETFQAVFRRVAYILLPFSLLVVKYFPDAGVEFNRWDGQLMWLGVTTHKNSLGQLCAVSLLLLLWMRLTSSRVNKPSGLNAVSCADLCVAGIGFFLLRGPPGSHSATSVAIFAVGSATLLSMRYCRRVGGFAIRHLSSLIAVILVSYLLFGAELVHLVANALGRDDTLTGRREIWDVLLSVASRNPLFGVGYGGFWGLHPEITAEVQVSQSHSGYLNVYLELGAVGLALLAVFVLSLCRRIRYTQEASSKLNAIAATCLITTLLYNVSESAFFTPGFLWTTTVIVAILASSARARSHCSDARQVVVAQTRANLTSSKRFRYRTSGTRASDQSTSPARGITGTSC